MFTHQISKDYGGKIPNAGKGVVSELEHTIGEHKH